ncbi:hypothetical protein H6P81_007701 [Aristolochia fimbriata]|uniref:Uncharacterized protein n=1 Tax=Aristolochia fimbriata TaxID=158543 RepID=A0AAV7F4B5_ARIFI|nr:hypothetical protein H6P81_007701 [Aristolochia fimbriata]
METRLLLVQSDLLIGIYQTRLPWLDLFNGRPPELNLLLGMTSVNNLGINQSRTIFTQSGQISGFGFPLAYVSRIKFVTLNCTYFPNEKKNTLIPVYGKLATGHEMEQGSVIVVGSLNAYVVYTPARPRRCQFLVKSTMLCSHNVAPAPTELLGFCQLLPRYNSSPGLAPPKVQFFTWTSSSQGTILHLDCPPWEDTY